MYVIRRRPSELGAQYRALLRKLEAEMLTDDERQELTPLIKLSEAFTVHRLEALGELAKLRNTTVPELMSELDIRPRRA